MACAIARCDFPRDVMSPILATAPASSSRGTTGLLALRGRKLDVTSSELGVEQPVAGGAPVTRLVPDAAERLPVEPQQAPVLVVAQLLDELVDRSLGEQLRLLEAEAGLRLEQAGVDVSADGRRRSRDAGAAQALGQLVDVEKVALGLHAVDLRAVAAMAILQLVVAIVRAWSLIEPGDAAGRLAEAPAAGFAAPLTSTGRRRSGGMRAAGPAAPAVASVLVAAGPVADHAPAAALPDAPRPRPQVRGERLALEPDHAALEDARNLAGLVEPLQNPASTRRMSALRVIDRCPSGGRLWPGTRDLPSSRPPVSYARRMVVAGACENRRALSSLLGPGAVLSRVGAASVVYDPGRRVDPGHSLALNCGPDHVDEFC